MFLCEFQARDGPRAQGSPAPYNQRTYQNWYEELEVRPWRLPQIPKQYHIFFITSKYHFIMFSFVLGPTFHFQVIPAEEGKATDAREKLSLIKN